MREVTEFTIKRSEWLRGEGRARSRLLRGSDAKKCCVGIYLSACGIPDSHLLDIRAAEDVRLPTPLWLHREWLHQEDAFRLYEINDDQIEEQDRELEIASIFAAHGITVTFED